MIVKIGNFYIILEFTKISTPDFEILEASSFLPHVPRRQVVHHARRMGTESREFSRREQHPRAIIIIGRRRFRFCGDISPLPHYLFCLSRVRAIMRSGSAPQRHPTLAVLHLRSLLKTPDTTLRNPVFRGNAPNVWAEGNIKIHYTLYYPCADYPGSQKI
uniref:Uncharacterized protein n=1 Tax=Araneus ventricosus TaxID=182803 RepID=A0A4Y2WM17_ARAVE|nr:hypothetical protein AVEN_26097-1 [Araneus ventricosus]